jgi:hypothetical protein
LNWIELRYDSLVVRIQQAQKDIWHKITRQSNHIFDKLELWLVQEFTFTNKTWSVSKKSIILTWGTHQLCTPINSTFLSSCSHLTHERFTPTYKETFFFLAPAEKNKISIYAEWTLLFWIKTCIYICTLHILYNGSHVHKRRTKTFQ